MCVWHISQHRSHRGIGRPDPRIPESSRLDAIDPRQGQHQGITHLSNNPLLSDRVQTLIPSLAVMAKIR